MLLDCVVFIPPCEDFVVVLLEVKDKQGKQSVPTAGVLNRPRKRSKTQGVPLSTERPRSHLVPPRASLLCCPISLSRCGLLGTPLKSKSCQHVSSSPLSPSRPPVPWIINIFSYGCRVCPPPPRLCLIQNHLSASRGSSARSFFFSVKSSRILLALKHICSVGSVAANYSSHPICFVSAPLTYAPWVLSNNPLS